MNLIYGLKFNEEDLYMNAFNLSHNSNTPFTVEQRIIHRLLVHSSLSTDIGLLSGKMGLAIFFMHYHQFTNNELYDDVATELMSEIIKELHIKVPITFDSGLPGIGWGVDYMIYKGFIEGDSSEICEEIDNRIMETDPRRMSDYSFETGLGGILYYVLGHLKMAYEQESKLPFDSIYLSDLYTTCNQLTLHKDKISGKLLRWIDSYQNYYNNMILPDNRIWELPDLIQPIRDFDSKSLSTYSLGLNNGLAGTLMLSITNNKLNRLNSY